MADFVATFECPPGRLLAPCRDWLQRETNMALPPEVLMNMSEASIEAAFRQQGQRWVPAPGGGGTHRGDDEHAMGHALLSPPLRPSRLPIFAAAASGTCLLAWLAVVRPMLRSQLAGSGRPGRPP